MKEILSRVRKRKYAYNADIYNEITSLCYHTDSERQFKWTKYISEPYYSVEKMSNKKYDFEVYSLNSTEIYNDFLAFFKDKKTEKIMYRGQEIEVAKECDSIIVQKYREHNVFVVLVDGKELLYVYEDENSFIERDLARVIRELFTREFEANNYFVFHASAISYKERGIMMCGRKEAGKTTSMLGFLGYLKDVKYIANDRVYMGKQESDYKVYGWPIGAAVRYGSCYNSKKLHNWIMEGDDETDLSNMNQYKETEIDRMTQKERWKIKKYVELTPKELAKVFNVQIAQSAVIETILFPKLNSQVNEPVVSKMDKSVIKEILKREVHSPIDESYPDRFYLIESNQKIEESVNMLIDDVASNLKCYQIEYSDFKSLIKFIESELMGGKNGRI